MRVNEVNVSVRTRGSCADHITFRCLPELDSRSIQALMDQHDVEAMTITRLGSAYPKTALNKNCGYGIYKSVV